MNACARAMTALVLAISISTSVQAANHYEQLADLPFAGGYPTLEGVAQLQNELLFKRAVQSYIWALPALNMYAMKEGSEKTFGAGYNVLPIWKDRLDAKTRVTTPNSDVIYAMGYLDLKQEGPMVIEVPPGLQGILDDFFQRPIRSESQIEGRQWRGDVGLPRPDKGKGAKYLVLLPDYKGEVPPGFLTYRSRIYGVFVFWRGFIKDPKQLEAPVAVMEQTRIYPLGKRATAKTMVFPNASKASVNMLYPTDGSAFDMLSRFIDHDTLTHKTWKCAVCSPHWESSKANHSNRNMSSATLARSLVWVRVGARCKTSDLHRRRGVVWCAGPFGGPWHAGQALHEDQRRSTFSHWVAPPT